MPESYFQNFNHLKIHSQYSICEGAIKIEDLKNYCKENKIKAIGLSDTQNLCGALEFSENISKIGTQPIIGTQINFKYKNYINLLPIIANNFSGYKSVINLSSKSYIENNSNEIPHCKFEDLFKIQEGITLLSGSINGLIGDLFKKNLIDEIDEIFNSINKKFQNRFYLEIQRHKDTGEDIYEKFLLEKSKKFDFPLLASHETFYFEKEMHEAHDALI